MSDEKPRLCGICGVTPIGPERLSCVPCFERADWIAKNDPYWFMREGATKPTPLDDPDHDG